MLGSLMKIRFRRLGQRPQFGQIVGMFWLGVK